MKSKRREGNRGIIAKVHNAEFGVIPPISCLANPILGWGCNPKDHTALLVAHINRQDRELGVAVTLSDGWKFLGRCEKKNFRWQCSQFVALAHPSGAGDHKYRTQMKSKH
jgi:hypothetical protein